MSYAILVLEQPWWELDEDPGQTSVRYFIDGLSRLHDLDVFYATFYDTSSFTQALRHLLSAGQLDGIDHFIVYIASHGSGARIGGGDRPGTNLSTIFERLAEFGEGRIAGLILDSCEVGGELATIDVGMQQAGIHWVLSYAYSVEWLVSTLINLHVLAVMTSLKSKDLEKPKRLKAAVQAALHPFNPGLIVESENDGDEAALVLLCEALSVFIHSGIKKAEPELLKSEDLWPELDNDDEEEED